MLSALFVDRPRLAIVIAIVTTIAGALALYSIPIAQYPDIVPPQVSVTTTFPGASAAVVDSTIAQPIEAQMVGVDKLIYMKSVSGDDGSYTLTASLEAPAPLCATASQCPMMLRKSNAFIERMVSIGHGYSHKLWL